MSAHALDVIMKSIFLTLPTYSVFLSKPYIHSFLFFGCIHLFQFNKAMHHSIIFILSIVIIQLASACYITNCPIGGKRNSPFDNNLQHHQCPRCGITGQCYGPSICCTSRGCRIGHPTDIRQCSTESRSTIPCSIQSTTCSAVPNGRCAANGVCCSPESCQMDESCSISSKQHALDLPENL